VEQGELFDALCKVATDLGIQLRVEPLSAKHSAGGLVKLRGRFTIVVDSGGSLPERIATLSTALARFDLSGVPLSEGLRRHLKAMSRRVPKGRRDNTLPLDVPAHKPGIRWARRKSPANSDEK
jgi:hypothetical protein